MPQTWLVDTPPRGHALPASAVSVLLDAPHDAAPAARMLEFLNEVAPVEYISLVAYDGHGDGGAPSLVEGHARSERTRNVTAECFAIYRRQYWRSDAATRLAQQVWHDAAQAADPRAPVAALHFGPGDIPVARWRNEIYDREHLSDRLSFLYAPLPDTVYAINLYRDDALGCFQPAEIERLLAVAPLLRQVHRGALHHTPAPRFAAPDAEARLQQARRAVKQQAPTLSPREAEVCARIACGQSADGIAAELDVAPSTVVTLRKRAYAKLAEAGLRGGRLALARLA